MEILPGFKTDEYAQMGDTQAIIYAVEHYLLIGLYTFLFVLINVNVWSFIIR